MVMWELCKRSNSPMRELGRSNVSLFLPVWGHKRAHARIQGGGVERDALALRYSLKTSPGPVVCDSCIF